MREVAPIYQQPPSADHLLPAPETEALMAEKVNILNPQQHNGYVEIELATDGYVGWIAADCCAVFRKMISGPLNQSGQRPVWRSHADVKSALPPACLWARLCGLATQKDLYSNQPVWPGGQDRQAIWQARHGC